MPIVDGKYRRPQLRNHRVNYRYGWFFVTFQVFHNKSVLGAIVGEECILNALGEAVKKLIETLHDFNPEVYVDCFVVMPNHVHLVLKIEDRPTNDEHHLGKIMRKLKSLAAREYRILGGEAVVPRENKPAIISTFTSPQEREVLRRLIAEGRRFISVYPGGIPVLLPCDIDDSVKAGRALLLSPVECGTGVNKQRAVWCNEYVIKRAARVWCGYISSGGTLHSILRAAGLAPSGANRRA